MRNVSLRSWFNWIASNAELVFWLAALTLLFFLPESKDAVSLCPLNLLGFGRCPGCGIGHSIHYALRLHPILSFSAHPLGIFGVIVIFSRIKQLLKPAL